MAIEKNIGKRIKILRKTKGITQEELSTLAGLDRGYISEIENGHINFSILTLCKIAHSLDTSMSEILDKVESEGGCKDLDIMDNKTI